MSDDKRDRTKRDSDRARAIETRLRELQAHTTKDQELETEIDKLCIEYLEEHEKRRSLESNPDDEITAIKRLHHIMGTKVTIPVPPLDNPPVTVRAPEQRPDPRVDPPPSSPGPPESGPESPVPASGAKILVVDDDPYILDSLTEILGEEGYRVWRARDGVEGIKRLYQMPRVDLILLDWQMPRLDGPGFLEIFDETPFSEYAKVLIISAFTPWSAPEETRERFVFMGKPLHLEKLLENVHKQIEESTIRRKALERK